MDFYFYSKNVYGIEKRYPGNEVAHQFAELLGVKTFNDQQLRKIQKLGFKIMEVASFHFRQEA